MSRLRREDLDELVETAQIALTDEEKEAFAAELQAIIDIADGLADVDTTGVELTIYGIERSNVMRPDEKRQSLSQEQALQNAPQPEDGFFRVPRILD